MEGEAEALKLSPGKPKNNAKEESPEPKPKPKPKIVVIMGATGSGKSRLAIDLASHFPIEIINADSMQVYQGLDVLTNKVPFYEQKGVPHHLLGTISPNVEFTAKDFRDAAIPLINEIQSRNHVPVIVGGTNYYIQALVSPFLLDDSVEDLDKGYPNDSIDDKQPKYELDFGDDKNNHSYDCLKDLDPIAAKRIHPNDQRKINQYLSLYARSGVLPSRLLQEKTMENWGRVDNSRYDCCFICVDASITALDQYVGQRVDHMVAAGLLNEVHDIYRLNSDYTRGLRQAIGVREFEDFLRIHVMEGQNGNNILPCQTSTNSGDTVLKSNLQAILNACDEKQEKFLLEEAIDKVKLNTRRLLRRQKRRLNQLQTLFGWNIHYVDATEALIGFSEKSWELHVVEPAVKIIKWFLHNDALLVPESEAGSGFTGLKLIQRDLWTQHICEACGNKVLRGAHEWEQHKQGRGHRKRMSLLRKSKSLYPVEQNGNGNKGV